MLDMLDPMHTYAFVGIHNASLGEKASSNTLREHNLSSALRFNASSPFDLSKCNTPDAMQEDYD